MKFGNNIEQMGFEKSGWVKIATSEDVTYMGKPSKADAQDDEPVWIVKKIEHHDLIGKDGFKYWSVRYSDPGVKWSEMKNLEYKYF